MVRFELRHYQSIPVFLGPLAGQWESYSIASFKKKRNKRNASMTQLEFKFKPMTTRPDVDTPYYNYSTTRSISSFKLLIFLVLSHFKIIMIFIKTIHISYCHNYDILSKWQSLPRRLLSLLLSDPIYYITHTRSTIIY